MTRTRAGECRMSVQIARLPAWRVGGFRRHPQSGSTSLPLLQSPRFVCRRTRRISASLSNRTLSTELVGHSLARLLTCDEDMPQFRRIRACHLVPQFWYVAVQKLSERLDVVVAQRQDH